MYVICTDGHEIVESRIIMHEYELVQLNEQARIATDNNYLWELGNKKNAELPKSEFYRHVSSELKVIGA